LFDQTGTFLHNNKVPTLNSLSKVNGIKQHSHFLWVYTLEERDNFIHNFGRSSVLKADGELIGNDSQVPVEASRQWTMQLREEFHII
jgi:hypothetical protein